MKKYKDIKINEEQIVCIHTHTQQRGSNVCIIVGYEKIKRSESKKKKIKMYL